VNPASATPPDVAAFTAYLARRKLARRFYGTALVVFFALAFICGITGIGAVPRVVIALGIAMLVLSICCEWYLQRSRCPRCRQRFAGDALILRSVALLTDKYLACQGCGLSEEELAGDEVIHDEGTT
jgi:uncharacterized membrane protein